MKMDKKLIVYLLVATIALLPSACGVTYSVSSNVGSFTENLGAGINNAMIGSTIVSNEGITHYTSATSSPDPTNPTSPANTLNLKESHWASNLAGAHAEVGVDISNAESYSYAYTLSPGEGGNWPDSVVQARESLDVHNAESAKAYAKAYNKAGYDAATSIQVTNGDLVGYSNVAQASFELVDAFQKFDTASGDIQTDSTYRALPLSTGMSMETLDYALQATKPDAAISTKVSGAVTAYTDGAVMSKNWGTELEQKGHIIGPFRSTATAGAESKTLTSSAVDEKDFDMQSRIVAGSATATGTLGSNTADIMATYFDTSNLFSDSNSVVQAASASSVIQAASTSSKIVLIRADDVGEDAPAISPGFTWLSGLISTKGVKATWAVIPTGLVNPDDNNPLTIAWLKGFDKNTIEMATHGYDHQDEIIEIGGTYALQYADIKKGTNIMRANIYAPTTFVAPYDNINENTLKACKALGYHTVTGVPVANQKTDINSLGAGFFWETYPTQQGSPVFATYDQFVTTFDAFMSSSTPVLMTEMHPNVYYDVNGNPIVQAQTDFANAIDYMKAQGVQFMTIDQEYQWLKSQ